jgi:DNA-binding transcriptional MerR regulator
MDEFHEYTAEEIAALLAKEDPKMTLRTVRYYRQAKFIPDLPVSNKTGKPVYTDEHLAHFRAIRTLSSTGESLESIRGRLMMLNTAQVSDIANEQPYYTSAKRVLERETIDLSPEVSLVVDRKLDDTLKRRIATAVSDILKGEK